MTRLDVVGCDQLAYDGALWGLYGWDPLRDFIGAVLGYEDFHRFADPIGAMTINVMNEGDGHGWHYDEAMFTVSVMLQAPKRVGSLNMSAAFATVAMTITIVLAAFLPVRRRIPQQFP